MSVQMTTDAVYARIKTATRRDPDTWRDLRPGDRLTLIEKGMGLPKGATQVVICDVEVTSNRVEPLGLVTPDEVRLEGLEAPAIAACEAGEAENIVDWFIGFWLAGHRWDRSQDPRRVPCRRIGWRYLDLGVTP